jgi:hypothetical protein
VTRELPRVTGSQPWRSLPRFVRGFFCFVPHQAIGRRQTRQAAAALMAASAYQVNA